MSKDCFGKQRELKRRELWINCAAALLLFLWFFLWAGGCFSAKEPAVCPICGRPCSGFATGRVASQAGGCDSCLQTAQEGTGGRWSAWIFTRVSCP